jgi:cyclophilin family peptidyl-prolyl cis-trans isomerase
MRTIEDDMSDARFLRGEVGLARHVRGAVGLVTHGRDTGNAQFFIDLDDEPACDRQYTVFARVVGTGPTGARNSVMPVRPGFGTAAVDALVDGTKITKITFPQPSR